MQQGYHVFYAGLVQGVGFRYTSRELAQKHNVRGWVRNCPDGRVELYVHGESKMLDAFLDDIDRAFKGQIRGREIKGHAIDETYADFRIIF